MAKSAAKRCVEFSNTPDEDTNGLYDMVETYRRAIGDVASDRQALLLFQQMCSSDNFGLVGMQGDLGLPLAKGKLLAVCDALVGMWAGLPDTVRAAAIPSLLGSTTSPFYKIRSDHLTRLETLCTQMMLTFPTDKRAEVADKIVQSGLVWTLFTNYGRRTLLGPTIALVPEAQQPALLGTIYRALVSKDMGKGAYTNKGDDGRLHASFNRLLTMLSLPERIQVVNKAGHMVYVEGPTPDDEGILVVFRRAADPASSLNIATDVRICAGKLAKSPEGFVAALVEEKNYNPDTDVDGPLARVVRGLQVAAEAFDKKVQPMEGGRSYQQDECNQLRTAMLGSVRAIQAKMVWVNTPTPQ